MSRRASRMSRLVLALLVGGSLSAASPCTAGAAADDLTRRIDALAIPALGAIVDAQRIDGTFRDPVEGTTGGNGMPQVAWVALRQALRLRGDASSSRGAR